MPDSIAVDQYIAYINTQSDNNPRLMLAMLLLPTINKKINK